MTGEMKMEDIYPLILKGLDECGEFVFLPKGRSMLPTIVQFKDRVKLIKADNIKKYSIVLYKRENGQFVMHRVVRIKNGTYTMCGDNQLGYEKGIKKEQIIALVSEIIHEDGKIVSCIGFGNYMHGFFIRAVRFIPRIWKGLKRRLYPIYKRIMKK